MTQPELQKTKMEVEGKKGQKNPSKPQLLYFSVPVSLGL